MEASTSGFTLDVPVRECHGESLISVWRRDLIWRWWLPPSSSQTHSADWPVKDWWNRPVAGSMRLEIGYSGSRRSRLPSLTSSFHVFFLHNVFVCVCVRNRTHLATCYQSCLLRVEHSALVKVKAVSLPLQLINRSEQHSVGISMAVHSPALRLWYPVLTQEWCVLNEGI